MTDNVIKLRDDQPSILLGPLLVWHVVIDNRQIPKLTGYKSSDGRIHLTLDGRFGAQFDNEEVAAQAAYLIANALAIGAGYSHLGAINKDAPFAPIATELPEPK